MVYLLVTLTGKYLFR